MICQQARVLLSQWQKWAMNCWWSYDREIWSPSQRNVRRQNSITMTVCSNVIYIHFCWWIFALISKQALLKMWFYYLCHCARMMVVFSQLSGCQQKPQITQRHFTNNWGRVCCTEIRQGPVGEIPAAIRFKLLKAVKPQWTSSNPALIHSCVTCFFFLLPFNNIHCGVSVVIKMGLVLFIFIRGVSEHCGTVCLCCTNAAIIHAVAEKPTALSLRDFCQTESLCRKKLNKSNILQPFIMAVFVLLLLLCSMLEAKHLQV